MDRFFFESRIFKLKICDEYPNDEWFTFVLNIFAERRILHPISAEHDHDVVLHDTDCETKLLEIKY